MSRSGLRIVTAAGAKRQRFAQGLRELTADATYPIGDDRFRIDRGPDPFAFVDAMGDAVFEFALDGSRVVAACARILRRRPRRCWYLCDLKVHPEYRGRRIATDFARKALVRSYLRCGRGYGISMNDPAASENRVERLARRLPMVPFKTSQLLLFSLDYDEVRAALPIVASHREGPIEFLSLGGVKDIVLESTGAPMPLLHAQFGPCARPGRRPRPGHVHMVAAPEGSPLAQGLSATGLVAGADATILHHRMGRSGFDFVLSSEI